MTTVTDYLAWASDVRRLRPATIRTYRNVLTTFTDHVGNPLEVTPNQITRFLNRERRGGRAPSASTQQVERATLGQFFDWLRRSGQMTADPLFTVPRVRVPGAPPKAIDLDVWYKFWASNLSCDDRVWLGLGYFAGLRRYEISTLAPSAFNLQTRTATFERKGGSTAPVEYAATAGVLQRTNPQLADAADAWADLLEQAVKARASEPFFAHWSRGVQPHDSDWMNRRLRRLLVRADLPERAFGPHGLRHSYATNLARAGVPLELIADQMSHSNLATTRGYIKTSGQLGRWTEASRG